MATIPQRSIPASPAFSCSGISRLVLVADDLTGACDSAVQLVRSGHLARVLLRDLEAEEFVLATSTGSRNMTADAASATLRRTIDAIPHANSANSVFFLKLDSAGRGPIGASILAAADSLQPEVVLYAPAFLDLDRHVDNGVLHVRDVAGQQTLIDLRSLFPSTAQSRLAVLSARSPAHLRDSMVTALEGGRDIWLCDSHSQQQMGILAQVALSLSLRVLWAGSGGLASALAAHLTPCEKVAALQRPTGTPLVICGTSHPVTQLQLRALQAQCAAAIVQPDWKSFTIDDMVSAFTATQPGTIVVTGGDTAAFMLEALRAESILLGGEVAPGIPWGLIHGGLADGCHVVTKSGGFGDEDALISIMDFCSGDAQ